VFGGILLTYLPSYKSHHQKEDGKKTGHTANIIAITNEEGNVAIELDVFVSNGRLPIAGGLLNIAPAVDECRNARIRRSGDIPSGFDGAQASIL
jgi:hypothetical protein